MMRASRHGAAATKHLVRGCAPRSLSRVFGGHDACAETGQPGTAFREAEPAVLLASPTPVFHKPGTARLATFRTASL